MNDLIKNSKMTLKLVFIVEALVCTLCAIKFSAKFNEGIFNSLVSPMSGLGNILRKLSLSSSLGNIFSIIIFLIIGLIPIAILMWKIIKKNFKLEDLLLIIISAFLFATLYWLINPGMMPTVSMVPGTEKNALVITLISIILVYIVIKAVTFLDDVKKSNILKVFRIVCVFSMAAIICQVFGINLSAMVIDIKKYSVSPDDMNLIGIENPAALSATQFIIFLKYIANQIVYIASFLIVKTIYNMVPSMKKSLINKEVSEYLMKISKICKVSLIIIMIAQAAANLLQMTFGELNYIANYNLSIPLVELIIISAILLIAKLINESIDLKEENSMFI